MTDVNRNADPLPEPEVKKVVDAWVSTLRTPTVAGGYLKEDENFLNVITQWKVEDAAKKEGVVFSRMYAVLKSSLESGNPVVSSPCSVTVDEKLAVPTKSGLKRAVLVEKAGTGDSSVKTEFLQIWSDATLLKSYNLGELDLHKSVYTSAGWGVTMSWNQSETKLAYLAEKKVPKPKPFYSTGAASKKEEDIKKNSEKEKEKAALGEEYIYKQIWGEQLTGNNEAVIVVVDTTNDEIKVIQLPDGNFPTDIQWIGDTHICGTTYPLPIWRLGLIFCSNRESIIFSVQADGDNFRLITEAKKASRSPRVRPDGGYLVWQERLLDGAHDRARSIYGMELKNGKPIGKPRLIYDSQPNNGIPVYQDFSRNCWTPNGSTLLAVTPSEAVRICLAIPIPIDKTALEQVKTIDRVDSLLFVTNKYLLVSSSSTLTGPVLKLLSISEDFKPIRITSSENPIVFPVEKQFISGEFSPPSIYIGPAADTVAPDSIPLIVYPHGGPSGTYVDSYSNEAVFFLKLGFAILRLNYVGSTGGARDTADELLGKVGDRDVKDCQSIVEKILNSIPTLNTDKVVVYGGSHGGFLGAHLSCQYPSVYKAAVLLNPVTDLGTMVGTSDITDWVYAHAGVTFPDCSVQTIIPTTRDLSDAEIYIAASPIHHVQNVEAATLLLLGSDDLRVPAQQGINYYRALKAYGKIAEMRMYADNHPLSKSPILLDSTIHTALWFKRHLQ